MDTPQVSIYTHLSIGIVCRDGEDGREYLVQEYNSGDGIQIKFPGGTNADQLHETPEETLAREYPEETGLELPRDARKIWSSNKMKNADGQPGFHQKIAFIAEMKNCRGTLRTEPMDDGGDFLSPPFWRTAEELLTNVRNGGLFWTHRPALQAAMIHMF